MRYFHRKTLRPALSLSLLLIAGCGSPGYNDNPSQQITTGRVGCLASAEFFSVYFSTHLKPAGETPGSNITRTRFRPYCGDLPQPGEVFFTADIIDPEIRKTPIAIQVVAMDAMENPGNPRTLFDAPARTFEKGTLEATFAIDKPGPYAIHLIRQDFNTGGERDRLTIPLNIGLTADRGILQRFLSPQFLLLVGLGVVGLVVFLKAYRFDPMKKP